MRRIAISRKLHHFDPGFISGSLPLVFALILIVAVISSACDEKPGRSESGGTDTEHIDGSYSESVSSFDNNIPALAPGEPLLVDYERNVYIPAKEDLVRSLKAAFT